MKDLPDLQHLTIHDVQPTNTCSGDSRMRTRSIPKVDLCSCDYRGTSLPRIPPNGPYCRPIPRVLVGSWEVMRFTLSEVPL